MCHRKDCVCCYPQDGKPVNTSPKLSSLTPTDKIRLAAELDGWKSELVLESSGDGYYTEPPHYSTSYDAIIPLIQKQDAAVRTRIAVMLSTGQNGVARCFDYLMKTPSQLLGALLVATEKATI